MISVTAAEKAEQDRLFRKIGWRLLPVLMIAYILAFVDRQNVGFAKLEFTRSLGFTEAVYGLGGGLFYLGYSLFEVPSNLLLRWVGARLTLLRIMIAWGLCSVCFAFMTTPMHYYVLRLLLGIAEAGFFPGILLFISFWIPASRRGSFTAVFMAAMPLAGVIGGPVSGLIMNGADGLSGIAGWQWMFIIEGVPSILFGLVVFKVLADSPMQAAWLDPREKDMVAKAFAAETKAKTGKAHTSFAAVLKDIRFYGLAGMAVSLLSCIAGFQLWMPTIIRNSHVTSLVHIGLLSALPSIVAVVAQQLNARHSDKLQERRWHAALPCLAAGLGFCMLPAASSNLVAAMACMTLIATGLFSATGPYWTLPSEALAGTAAAGGIALITSLGGIGAFVSSSFVGSLNAATGTSNAGLYYFAALAIAGPILMLVSTRKTAVT